MEFSESLANHFLTTGWPTVKNRKCENRANTFVLCSGITRYVLTYIVCCYVRWLIFKLNSLKILGFPDNNVRAVDHFLSDRSNEKIFWKSPIPSENVSVFLRTEKLSHKIFVKKKLFFLVLYTNLIRLPASRFQKYPFFHYISVDFGQLLHRTQLT